MSYGLHWDLQLLWEYKNKTMILAYENHDNVEICNYKKKMIVKFN